MKMQLQIPLEYGLLFLSDPYGEDEVPPDTGAASVTFTDTCVAMQTPAYVDGDADIIISDLELSDEGKHIFSGAIEVPSQIISLSDPKRFNYFMLPLSEPYCSVNVWEYNRGNNRKIWVTLTNIDLI